MDKHGDIDIRVQYGSSFRHFIKPASEIDRQMLNQLIKKELGFKSEFKLMRKSKKIGSYVELKTPADYRTMKRSLQVKNHLKLLVEDINCDYKSDSNDGEQQLDNFNLKELSDKVEKIYTHLIKPEEEEKTHSTDMNLSDQPDHFCYCDVCSEASSKSVFIKGDRHKCAECFNYDLCSDCFAQKKTSGTHQSSHRMYLIASLNSNRTDDFLKMDISLPDDEIAEYKQEVQKLLQETDTLAKLKELKDSSDKYHELLKVANHDEKQLYKCVESLSQTTTNTNSSTIPELDVKVSKYEQNLKFHITNRGSQKTPKNLILTFSFASDDILTTYTLLVGPHHILPGGHKILYYYLQGIKYIFNGSENFTIELIDGKTEQVYASGKCLDNSGFVMLTAKELSKNSVLNDGHHASDSPTSSLDSFVTPMSSAILEKEESNSSNNLSKTNSINTLLDTYEVEKCDLVSTDLTDEEDYDDVGTFTDDYEILSTSDQVSDEELES